MFVRSRMDKPMTFRKGGKSWVIKPHSMTLIDDPAVTAKEIKGCYGSRVEVISDETSRGGHEGGQIVKNVVKSKIEKSIIKKVEPKKIDEKSLDDILAQVNKELEEIDDNKKVDTTENNKSDKPEVIVKRDNDDKLKVEDSDVDKAPSKDSGDEPGDNKEKKETKPARARRTSSNKGAAKRVSRKKATKK